MSSFYRTCCSPRKCRAQIKLYRTSQRNPKPCTKDPLAHPRALILRCFSNWGL